MAIKIRIKTEGENREPYEMELEVTQDTIVASFSLFEAIASAILSNEGSRDSVIKSISNIIGGMVQAKLGLGGLGAGLGPTIGGVAVPPEVAKRMVDHFLSKMKASKDIFKHDNAKPDFPDFSFSEDMKKNTPKTPAQIEEEQRWEREKKEEEKEKKEEDKDKDLD